MVYDFCGYATRNNVKCSDGRIILKDAFKDDDGKKVPLVWNHQHNSPENVLGHAILENRDDGVYAYAVFNDNDMGQRAKELVRHGDISALSIYANKLKEQAGRVMHGIIREVSLVLAGANPEAMIDSFVAHSDGSVTEDRDQGWFYSGMEGELYHADSEDDKDKEDDEEVARMKRIEKMMALKKKKSSGDDDEEETASDDESEPDEEEDEDEEANDSDEDDEDEEGDSDDSDADDDEDDEEKNAKHSDSDDSDEGEETIGDVMNSFTDKQKVVVMALIEDALETAKNEEPNNKEDKPMAHRNLFENDNGNDQNNAVLSHNDEMKIVSMAKDSSIGSLKSAMKAFCDDEAMAHGFDSQSLTLMFPEYKDVKPGAPEMLTTDQGWITKVLNKVHKSPMSRVRTRFTDIRNIENLRAKGYTKGTQKVLQGDVSALYRTTEPQTVYVRSDLDRDDIIDIVDFDYVAYMYNIDRMMLNEELATAIMLGDGRQVGAQYKIDETKIRPIWTDDELYTIHRLVDLTGSSVADLQGLGTTTSFGENFIYAETFVQELLYGREAAKNVGVADLYITPHVLNKMLLARDMNGRRIYNTVEELRSALNVREIITCEQFEGKTRSVTVSGTTTNRALMGILVNLDNYHLGANKGGEITHFTDFDINFNKEQSLLETRVSGANVRPLSALVLECVATNPPQAGGLGQS